MRESIDVCWFFGKILLFNSYYFKILPKIEFLTLKINYFHHFQEYFLDSDPISGPFALE